MKRSILITGCSSGIGLCAAEGLQARGYRVFATARKAADVEQLAAKGLEALLLDVADSESIQFALDEILARTGGTLDALFNNAGYGQPGAVEDLSRAALRAQFETNLFGMVDLTNRVIPVMRRQGQGRIVQNSSILGYIVLAYRGAYNASKFAIEGMTDTLRLELRGSGISVSLIEPGPIKSRFGDKSFTGFESHIDAETSAHRAQYAAMVHRLQKPGPAAPFTLGPEAVLQKLIHALESPRPRARYPVTKPAIFFTYAKRLLPTVWLDRILGHISDRETQ